MKAVFVPWFIKRRYAVPDLKPGEFTWLSQDKTVCGVMMRLPSGETKHFFEAHMEPGADQAATLEGDEETMTLTDASGKVWIANGEWV